MFVAMFEIYYDKNIKLVSIHKTTFTGVIPKVSSLDMLHNNIFHNLYISETNVLNEL